MCIVQVSTIHLRVISLDSHFVEGHDDLKSDAVLDYCWVNRLDGGLTVTVYHYLPTLYFTVLDRR